MDRRVALAVAGAAAILLANITIFGGSQKRSLHRERKIYDSVATRAIDPIFQAQSLKSANTLATCLASNPTGRFNMTLLSRGVSDSSRRIGFDRVVLHDAMALLGGVTATDHGGSRLVIYGRSGRRLHDRERATIAACL